MESLMSYADLEDINFTDSNNNDKFDNPASSKGDKYSLRPRSVRRITEKSKPLEESGTQSNRHSSKISSKPKAKSAPLSKYRRKTANARERNRMREINQAFEALRRVVPHMQVPTNSSNEKLTKITTLRLAMKYINALSTALNNPMEMAQPDYSDLDAFLLESDGESLSLSDHSGSFLASPDFPEPSLSPVDFGDPSLPSLLHTDFTDHALEGTDLRSLLSNK
ncbi:helix-loop-helix protein delilah-like isoform X2 [Euwallacea fornicatus]|uniref:helix-loop-helix protein delilah-like isoform X2 n=1 Tax=Euwallacea fornicatus TaxID=995702 RepID=UPI00338F3AB1